MKYSKKSSSLLYPFAICSCRTPSVACGYIIRVINTCAPFVSRLVDTKDLFRSTSTPVFESAAVTTHEPSSPVAVIRPLEPDSRLENTVSGRSIYSPRSPLVAPVLATIRVPRCLPLRQEAVSSAHSLGASPAKIGQAPWAKTGRRKNTRSA